jgi:RNA polymerase sigma-70 factor (ECF subfamily)
MGPRVAEQQEFLIDDGLLVERARGGDHGAFRVLVERHTAGVTRMVAGMLGPSDQIDDVVQETFIRFFRSLGQFRTESSVGTYLKRIAINQALDYLRRRKRLLARFLSRDDDRQRLPESAAERGRTIEDRERDALVQRAIASLPEKQRAVVLLRMIDGCSTDETAEILGIAYGTVLSRLSRGQERLKELLAPYVEEQRTIEKNTYEAH